MHTPSEPRRAVVLLHEGHGTPHLDLLLERDDGPLVTFRTPVGVTLLLPPQRGESFDAERMSDHRRDYLEYQGPISGGRGVVRRIAVYSLSRFLETDAGIALTVQPYPGHAQPGTGASDWRGGRLANGLWRFEGTGRLLGPAA